MKLNIQTIDCSITENIENHIREAVGKLETKYNWIESTDFIIKSEKHDRDLSNLVEIKMAVPGNDLYCDVRDEKLELAINRAIDKISRLLEDKKDKDFGHPTSTPL